MSLVPVDLVGRARELVPVDVYFREVHRVVLKPSGPFRLRGRCPFHGDEESSLEVVNTLDHYNGWRCHGCSASPDRGSVIEAVMRGQGLVEALSAALWLDLSFGLGLTPGWAEPGVPGVRERPSPLAEGRSGGTAL